MDKPKIMQAINQFIIEKYIQGLRWTKLHKVTLFTTFPYTGAPNWSQARTFLMIDDLTAWSALRLKHSRN